MQTDDLILPGDISAERQHEQQMLQQLLAIRNQIAVPIYAKFLARTDDEAKQRKHASAAITAAELFMEEAGMVPRMPAANEAL